MHYERASEHDLDSSTDIMVTALTFHHNRLPNGGHPKAIIDVLTECFPRGVLSQPSETNIGEYLEYAKRVFKVIRSLNIVCYDLYNVVVCNAEDYLFNITDAEEVLGFPLLSIDIFYKELRVTPSQQPIAHRSTTEPTFRADDLNIETLSTLGKVKLAWTEVLEEHLELTSSLCGTTLKIYWFPYLPGEPTNRDDGSHMYARHL